MRLAYVPDKEQKAIVFIYCTCTYILQHNTVNSFNVIISCTISNWIIFLSVPVHPQILGK